MIFHIQPMNPTRSRARARLASLPERRRATPATAGLSTFPWKVQRASVTCGLLTMRLAFQVAAGVIKYSLPSATAIPTGEPTPWPLRRNVVKNTVGVVPGCASASCMVLTVLLLLIYHMLLFFYDRISSCQL